MFSNAAVYGLTWTYVGKPTKNVYLMLAKQWQNITAHAVIKQKQT